jgi:hypothetical protein
MKMKLKMKIMTDADGTMNAPPRRHITRRFKMKLALALMLMTTALGPGTVALAAAPGRNLMPAPKVVGQSADQAPDSMLILIDDDGDDDDEDGGWRSSSDDEDEDEDDDDDDDDDDCEGEDDEDNCASATTGNASKAGTVAPPRNGLFTTGTAPVVKSN